MNFTAVIVYALLALLVYAAYVGYREEVEACYARPNHVLVGGFFGWKCVSE